MFGVYNLEYFDGNNNAVYKHLKYPNRYSMKKGSLRDGIEGWWVSELLVILFIRLNLL